VNADRVVLGIGNRHRRDDGVGPAVAGELAAHDLPGVRVVCCAAEPTALLDAWTGARLAVLVDAVAGGEPGRVRCIGLGDLGAPAAVSTHELDLAGTYGLGLALGRVPRELVIAPWASHGNHPLDASVTQASSAPAALCVTRAARRRSAPSRARAPDRPGWPAVPSARPGRADPPRRAAERQGRCRPPM
jgi:hydrogenase maturation protease